VTVPHARVRAVVDTNVLVSGLISAAGPPARIVNALRRERFDLIVSPAVLDELLDVLLRPYLGVTVREAASMVATIRRRGHLVGGEYLEVKAVRDPKDNIVLACALEGDAQYLVSGDRDLLVLKDHHVAGHRVVHVVRPRDFLQNVLGKK
jgi:putative PIN family toxin of toxin-antitoxin system